MTKPETFEDLRQRFQTATARALPDHIERAGWSGERIAVHQLQQLRRLLAHAIAHSPYHARRLSGVDPRAVELGDLPSLPVMTKADMMASFDDVVTDRRLSRAAVEECLEASRESPRFLDGEFQCMASGGSSGVRGIFAFGWEAAVDFALAPQRATLKRVLSEDLPEGGLVLAFVTAPTAVHATGASAYMSDGGMGGLLRTVRAPSTLPLAEIVERLNVARPSVLAGYPSVLRLLAEEKRAGRLRIEPRSIAATSELLTPEACGEITSAFGVAPANVFGSTEGLMGSGAPGEDAITFASDLAIAELVDKHNRPVPPGTPSAKVLVTNLYNLAQPLIRYELTDSFVEEPAAPDHGHLRATVSGRSDEVFTYGSVRVHPLVIRSPLVKSPEVLEYQVRQTPRGADLAVVAAAVVDPARVARDVARSLADAGLPDPEVTVRCVDVIERDARTGKARRFIPLSPDHTVHPPFQRGSA
jgi:phenylacetate-CoA ligase